MSTISYTFFDCPIGLIRIRASENGLVAIDHVNQQSSTEENWQKCSKHPVIVSAVEELEAYFKKQLTSFSTPLSPVGTDFQTLVWNQLTQIPYGETWSYQDVAKAIEKPKAVRAVGLANGKNPLSIFIPCHRVIGKNGKLTGYAGGLAAKKILLALESNSPTLF